MGNQSVLLVLLSFVMLSMITYQRARMKKIEYRKEGQGALVDRALEVSTDAQRLLKTASSPVPPDSLKRELGIRDSLSIPKAGGFCAYVDHTPTSFTVACKGGGSYSDLEVWGIYDEDENPDVRVSESKP